MRTEIAFDCGALIHAVETADNNCPVGQVTLNGSPCLDSKMASFLICFIYTGKGITHTRNRF